MPSDTKRAETSTPATSTPATRTDGAAAASAPQRELSRAEVEAELHDRSDDINRRIDALEAEVSTAGTSIKEDLLGHPLVSLGGAALAGLAVGLLLGGWRRRRRKRRYARSHRALIDTYLDAVSREVRRAIGRGRTPEQAVREALRDRTPLIIQRTYEEDEQGAFREGFDLFIKTIFSWFVRSAVDTAAAKYVSGGESAFATTEDEGSSAVISAVSEET